MLYNKFKRSFFQNFVAFLQNMNFIFIELEIELLHQIFGATW